MKEKAASVHENLTTTMQVLDKTLNILCDQNQLKLDHFKIYSVNRGNVFALKVCLETSGVSMGIKQNLTKLDDKEAPFLATGASFPISR